VLILFVEYVRITGNMTRTTALYFCRCPPFTSISRLYDR
jgi:hypothetical protein